MDGRADGQGLRTGLSHARCVNTYTSLYEIDARYQNIITKVMMQNKLIRNLIISETKLHVHYLLFK